MKRILKDFILPAVAGLLLVAGVAYGFDQAYDRGYATGKADGKKEVTIQGVSEWEYNSALEANNKLRSDNEKLVNDFNKLLEQYGAVAAQANQQVQYAPQSLSCTSRQLGSSTYTDCY